MWEELFHARNVRPAFKWGLLPGMAYAAVDQFLLRGKAWWTLTHGWVRPRQLMQAQLTYKDDLYLAFQSVSISRIKK